MTLDDKKKAIRAKVDGEYLILYTQLHRVLGISLEYLKIIQKELNIPTIKRPRMLKGVKCFNYRKIRLNNAYEIAEYLEGKRGA